MFLPSKSKFAFQESVKLLPPNRKGHVFLWTFTFKTCVDVDVARKFWSMFLENLRVWKLRSRGKFHGFRVFELHPGGHGLHIHVVTDCFWWVVDVRMLWQLMRTVRIEDENGRRVVEVQGGRVNVVPIPVEKAGYAGKYLSKSRRPECLKGVAMWRAFGGQEYTRVKDIKVESNWTRAYAYLRATVRSDVGLPFDHLPWWKRRMMVDNVVQGRVWWWATEFRPSCFNDVCECIDISQNYV